MENRIICGCRIEEARYDVLFYTTLVNFHVFLFLLVGHLAFFFVKSPLNNYRLFTVFVCFQ